MKSPLRKRLMVMATTTTDRGGYWPREQQAEGPLRDLRHISPPHKPPATQAVRTIHVEP